MEYEEKENSYDEGMLREVKRYERMLQENDYYYFDLNAIDDVYTYYINRLDYKKAMDLVDFAMEQHPANSELHYKKANLHMDIDEAADAVLEAKKAVTLDPYVDEYRFILAEALNFCDDLVACLEVLEEAFKTTDAPAEIYYQMAYNCFLGQHLVEAEAYLRKALEIEPEHQDAFLQLTHQYELQENFIGAKLLYEEYLENHPYSAMIWLRLGDFYFSYEDYFNAAECADYSLVIQEENNVEAHFLKAEALYMLKEYQKSLQAFLEYRLHNPGDVRGIVNIGRCFFALGNFAGAKKYLLKAGTFSPDYPSLNYLLGNCLEKEERYLEAIHYYRKEAKQNKKDVFNWLALSRAEFMLGNQVSCFEALEKAIHTDPHEINLWKEWAEFLFAQDNISGAIQFLKEGLKVNGDATPLFYQLAAYCFLQGNITEGMTVLENALIMDYIDHEIFLEFLPKEKLVPAILDLIEQYLPDYEL